MITNSMSIYQSIKNLGRKALLVSGLVAILSGCDTNVEQFQRRNIFEDLNKDNKPEVIYLQPNRKQTREEGAYIYPTYDLMVARGDGEGNFKEPKIVLHYDERPGITK